MGRKKGYRKYGEDLKMVSIRLPLSTIKSMEHLSNIFDVKNKAQLVSILVDQQMKRENEKIEKMKILFRYVAIRVKANEKELQNTLRETGAKWDREKKYYWWVQRIHVLKLELQERIVEELGEKQNIKHL